MSCFDNNDWTGKEGRFWLDIGRKEIFREAVLLSCVIRWKNLVQREKLGVMEK